MIKKTSVVLLRFDAYVERSWVGVKLSTLAGKDTSWTTVMLEGGGGRGKPTIEHLLSLPFPHLRDDGQHWGFIIKIPQHWW